MPRITQQSVGSLPEHEQAAAMSRTERASNEHPSILVDGHLLHVCQMAGEWEVWLNTEDADFTGLCVSAGRTREEAVAEAVRMLKAAVAVLQQQPPAPRSRQRRRPS